MSNELFSKENMVEGFDPSKYLKESTNSKTGEISKYLPVSAKIIWFKKKYPEGRIVTESMFLQGVISIVEAKIYAKRDDKPEDYLAKRLGQRTFVSHDVFGSRYVECAETSAIGRALSELGFDLLGVADDDDIANNGVSGVNEDPLAEGDSDESTGDAHGDDRPSETADAADAGMPKNSEKTAKKTKKPEEPPKPSYTKDTPVDEILAAMTVEEARGVILQFSKENKHNGKTLAQIAVDAPEDLKWLAESYQGRDNILRAGATKILEWAAEKSRKAS